MANIIQRLFYKPVQCKALDFIKENKDNIEYYKCDKLDEFDKTIGTMHNVQISAGNKVLIATLTKYKSLYPFRDNDVSYTFKCMQPIGPKCNDCLLNKPVYEFGGFASTVYIKMLNHYIAKHGCPHER